MIRYKGFDRPTLEAHVHAHDHKWLAKAGQRTTELKKAGYFLKRAPIWGDIKPAFMRLQHHKCVFCERPLAEGESGNVEHDVEHFRPKSSIKAWPKTKDRAVFKYNFATGPASTTGYYWLPTTS